jgi:hypothetical protein
MVPWWVAPTHPAGIGSWHLDLGFLSRFSLNLSQSLGFHLKSAEQTGMIAFVNEIESQNHPEVPHD